MIFLSAGGRAAPPPADEVIEAFADKWELGGTGILFIRKLPQEIVGVVLRTFHTTQDRGECDTEFIRHAMLMEEAWNNGEILESSRTHAVHDGVRASSRGGHEAFVATAVPHGPRCAQLPPAGQPIDLERTLRCSR